MTTCPDVRPLLEFKAANLDPFGILDSWIFPCNITEQTRVTMPGKAATAGPGDACPRLQAYLCQNWYGVNCTSSLRVWNITLNFKGAGANDALAAARRLYGNFQLGQSMPPSFGELGELQHLDLAYNFGPPSYLGGLIGPLPLEISGLSKLTFLDLSYNRFWGSLPAGLASLAGLQTLNLASNNFTGTLPGWLGNLTALTSLNLVMNAGITGSLPGELGQLVSLQYLALTQMPVYGAIPDSLAGLRSLTNLVLNALNLTGSIPSWLGQLKNLSSVDLSLNALTGSIPIELGQAPALSSLLLWQNKLTGPIGPELVAGLCNSSAAVNKSATLSFLDLGLNELSGDFPYGLAACTGLLSLFLHNNKITGAFPGTTFLSALAGLSDFGIEGNQLSGTVPGNMMALMPQLSTFNLQDNNLSGPMPRLSCNNFDAFVNFTNNNFTGELADILGDPAIATCVNPQADGSPLVGFSFYAANNRLSGPLPPFIFSLRTLKEVHIDGNEIEGAIPRSWSCSRQLTVFSASENKISGRIPHTLGNCTNLQTLNLAHNQLSGGIPDALRRIGPSLQNLQLQGNSLTGPLPLTLYYFQQLRTLNVSHNALSQSLPEALTSLANLVSMDLSHNNLSGPLLLDMGNLTIANAIDLSYNAFSGPIPDSLAPPNLPFLTFLDLSHNDLTGSIPYNFANTSAQNVTLNFASNDLSGPLPGGENSTFATTVPPSSVANNSDLCGGAGYPACQDGGGGGLSTGALVGICVGGAVGLLLILLTTFWFLHKRNEWAGGTMLVFEKLDFHLTVDDLLEATENFSDSYKLGRGGFGTVYRATLQDGRTVAIKRLASQSAQGDREFQAEMQTLGNIRHRNLVVLVAAYIAPAPSSERLLVYNFLSGGSLDNILNSAKDMAKDSPYRQWEVRRNIALDVARGLKYLHHDCTPRIIHRDMKPANVLMDDQLLAHVADFGLAREVDTSRTHMSTAVFGTIGYMAPEYTQRGRLTFKSDVFAYGVMLLQLITGKQPTDEDVAERGLARWVGASSAASVVDDRMHIGPFMNQILGAIKLALLCTNRVPADRPSMAEVVHLLENLDDFAKGITNPEEAV